MASPPPGPPNIQLLFGPFLIGSFINMILYGVLLMQVFTYLQCYKKDMPWVKYLVLYVFLIATINIGCDMGVLYQPLIINFGRPEATTFFPMMFPAEPITIVAVSTPIQLFFAWRVKVLTKSNLLFGAISILSLASCVGGVWTGVRIVQLKLFAKKPELHDPALVWFLAAAVADLLITATLVHNLSSRKTGFSKTDDAISRIIRMTVQTGMLTAFFAVGDVVFFMTLPHTALNFIWDFALSKLYAICLLSTLNARAHLQEIAYSSEGHRLPSGDSRTKGTGIRRTPGLGDTHGSMFSAPVYELNDAVSPVKSHEHYPYEGDAEYGVTITKVTETIQDTPLSPVRGVNGPDFGGVTQ